MRAVFHLAALLAFMASAGPAGAASFEPVLDLSLAGEYSAFQGGPGSINYPGRALFIPMMALSKRDLLAPVLMVDAKFRDKPLPEDSEPFISRWTFLAKPTYKHVFPSKFDATATLLAKRVITNDEFNRPWSKGLYDHEEFGGGAKLGYGGFSAFKGLALGLQWSHKGYVNNKNPAPTGNKNYYIKDLDILKIDVDADLPPLAGLDLGLNYSLSLRNYSDSYVFRELPGADGLPSSDGQISATLRSEQFHLLRASAKGAWSKAWLYGLDLEGVLNASNHNEFDFQQNYYKKNTVSFNSAALSPSLSWLPQQDPKGHSLLLSYRALYRAYGDKPVRNSDGSYTKGAQADAEHSFLAKGVYANLLTKGLGLYGLVDYTVARSNQGLESAAFRFSYDLFMAQIGLEYRL